MYGVSERDAKKGVRVLDKRLDQTAGPQVLPFFFCADIYIGVKIC